MVEESTAEKPSIAKRPLGITALCVMGWLEALLILLGGLALAVLRVSIPSLLSLLGGNIFGTNFGTPLLAGNISDLFGGIVVVLGIALVILGVASFIIVYWLWQMQKRGWKWAVYSQATNLSLGVVEVLIDPTALTAMIGLIIPAIFVIYLWLKRDLFK